MANLFEQLSGMRETLIPVVLQSGTTVEMMRPDGSKVQQPIQLPGSVPFQFQIRTLTPNELLEADRALDEAKAPVMKRMEPNPRGIGEIEVQVGYDYDSPAYLMQQQRLMPMRHSLICLYGCPALMETTTGLNTQEKAASLMDAIPAQVLQWLANEIESIPILAQSGPEAVASFFPEGSGNSRSSPDSKSPKVPGVKSKPSKGSTAPTTTTRSGKRPASGA